MQNTQAMEKCRQPWLLHCSHPTRISNSRATLDFAQLASQRIPASASYPAQPRLHLPPAYVIELDPIWTLARYEEARLPCNFAVCPQVETRGILYRDRLKGVQMLLSRTQAGTGRRVKQEQEEISPNNVTSHFRGLCTACI